MVMCILLFFLPTGFIVAFDFWIHIPLYHLKLETSNYFRQCSTQTNFFTIYILGFLNIRHVLEVYIFCNSAELFIFIAFYDILIIQNQISKGIFCPYLFGGQHDLTFCAQCCTAHQMEIFAQDFEPASYFCGWTCVHLIMRQKKQGPILENELLQKMKLSKNCLL